MLNKDYFFKGKGYIRKIKDKAFYDFVIAHQNAGNSVVYTPTKVYIGDGDKRFVTDVRVTGGAITMDYALSSSGHWLSEEDWNTLFELSGMLLELHDRVVEAASELAVANYQYNQCSYADSAYFKNKVLGKIKAFNEAEAKFKSELSK